MPIITSQASSTSFLAILRDRIYGDYFMPNRFAVHRQVLEAALKEGYRFESIPEHWARQQAGQVVPGEKVFILRHDIDTDRVAAAKLFDIEADLGIRSSYYFRLRTLDRALMTRIHAFGSEASYHYEEVATVIKAKGLRTEAEARAALPEAQELFSKNLARLRKDMGLPFSVVASHGDFANRELNLPNWSLLEDRAFRASLGIDLEVYDEAFMKAVTFRASDLPYPKFWKPVDPLDGIQAQEPFIYLLVHPRNWRSHLFLNTEENALRVWEGLRLGWKQKRRARA